MDRPDWQRSMGDLDGTREGVSAQKLIEIMLIEKKEMESQNPGEEEI